MSKPLGWFVLVGVVAATVQAQYNEGWFQPTYSSTAEEGIQRGYADIVRSQGMANLMNSKAAKEYELARREYLDNRMKATQVYFDMRRTNAEARKATRATPLSQEQYVRLAREDAPDALTTSQLDPLTGYVRWPAPLNKPEYAAARQALDKLFKDRAAGHAPFGGIQAACDDLSKQLKADLTKFSPNDYLVAKKFVDSLAHAARTMPG